MQNKLSKTLVFTLLILSSCTKKEENPYYLTVLVDGQAIEMGHTDIMVSEPYGLYFTVSQQYIPGGKATNGKALFMRISPYKGPGIYEPGSYSGSFSLVYESEISTIGNWGNYSSNYYRSSSGDPGSSLKAEIYKSTGSTAGGRKPIRGYIEAVTGFTGHYTVFSMDTLPHTPRNIRVDFFLLCN
ncbi:MAG: hypothetical protein IBJ09_03370 [Bacteroidia bacterium]|nr:hypothetical protein [Bacteroidia bacterium]